MVVKFYNNIQTNRRLNMATLYGYARIISWLGADHTYVKSSDGYVWPCWGGSSGGRLICSGTGSSGKANCISQPSSTAGIIYGVTGVCHQTANRILYPAGTIVSAAAGYWASIILYGTYGTNNIAALIEWEGRKLFCINSALGVKAQSFEPKTGTKAIKEPTPEPGISAYLDKVKAIYAAQTSEMKISAPSAAQKSEFLSQELELLFDYRLGLAGVATDSKNITGLQKFQGSILDEKEDLDAALFAKNISTAKYAQEVNELVLKFMKESGTLLGRDLHTKVFGMPPDAKFKVVDPKELAKSNKDNRDI